MKVKLNLIENSYDYLCESCKYFVIADEFGLHDEKLASYENKIKWKMSYVTLVQAFELMLKEGLKTISPILIYEDIDKAINVNSKTVSGAKAITRLSNCKIEMLNKENMDFIKKCIEKRNTYIHCDVEIDSASIKPSYCKLFELYIKLHNKVLPDNQTNLEEILKEKCNKYENILAFTDDYTIFRNEEMRKSDKELFLKDIATNKYTGTCVDINGNVYERIPYGSEEFCAEVDLWEYCPDCSAAIGEFHYKYCDIEICPKCGKQFLACDCEMQIIEKK